MSVPNTIIEILGDDTAVGTAVEETSSIEISIEHEVSTEELESTQFLEVWDGRGPAGRPASLRRVVSAVTTPTLAVDINSYDMAVLTAQATSLQILAPTGTPTDGQGLMYRIKDNGSPISLTWNGIFRAIGSLFPSTTTSGKTLYVGVLHNSADTRWDVIAVGEET